MTGKVSPEGITEVVWDSENLADRFEELVAVKHAVLRSLLEMYVELNREGAAR